MVYDGVKHSDRNQDIFFSNNLLYSGAPKERRVKAIFKDRRIHEEELEDMLDESREEHNTSRFDNTRLRVIALDIERLVEEAKQAPEDFTDPLCLQLMKGESDFDVGTFFLFTVIHSSYIDADSLFT